MTADAFRLMVLAACGGRPSEDERQVYAAELRDVAMDLEALEAIPVGPSVAP